mgnify:CR=1 FL=1
MSTLNHLVSSLILPRFRRQLPRAVLVIQVSWRRMTICYDIIFIDNSIHLRSPFTFSAYDIGGYVDDLKNVR